MQDSGPHLGADALALVALTQPGSGADLTHDREVPGTDALHPDHDAVEEDGQLQIPVPRSPVGQYPPVELHDTAGSLGRRQISPRYGERHPARGMDSLD